MIHFENTPFLWLLLLIVPMFYLIRHHESILSAVFAKEVLEKIASKQQGFSKKSRNLLLITAFALSIVALARPVIDYGSIKVKSSFINVAAAIDISQSMFAEDVYPSRFAFAQNSFIQALDTLPNAKVGLLGFSSQTFLISPLTEDFHSLQFLTKNMNVGYLNLKGTNILSTLQSANELLSDKKQKIVLLFTDGGDQQDFSQEIAYAKTHNIAVYIYNIGTLKGSAVKSQNGMLKDHKGDLVIVKRNDAIKALALESGGAYMHYSLDKNAIETLTQTIENRYQATEAQTEVIEDKQELFYIPLALGILLFFMALFSMPQRRMV